MNCLFFNRSLEKVLLAFKTRLSTIFPSWTRKRRTNFTIHHMHNPLCRFYKYTWFKIQIPVKELQKFSDFWYNMKCINYYVFLTFIQLAVLILLLFTKKVKAVYWMLYFLELYYIRIILLYKTINVLMKQYYT